MIFKEQEVTLWGECPEDFNGAIAFIERAGRVCYQSQDKIGAETGIKFVHGIVRRGHLSVLRFGTLIIKRTFPNIEAAERALSILTNPYFKSEANHHEEGVTVFIGGNWQAWWEWFLVTREIPAEYDRLQLFDSVFSDPETNLLPRGWKKISPSEAPTSVRAFAAVFVCDRAVTHELVRHTTLAFLQESQRYCAYKEQVEYITPYFFKELSNSDKAYYAAALEMNEEVYQKAIKDGLAPQKARFILANATACQIAMTGFVDNLKHLVHMRDDKAAYTPIREMIHEFRVGMQEHYNVEL